MDSGAPVTQARTWRALDERKVHARDTEEDATGAESGPGQVARVLEGSATTSFLGFRGPGKLEGLS